jgi:hypothetical protein
LRTEATVSLTEVDTSRLRLPLWTISDSAMLSAAMRSGAVASTQEEASGLVS